MKLIICSFLIFFACNSCKKYLDQKPDSKLQLPTTVEAVQGLLDNESSMNLVFPATGEVSADNYYVPDATFNGLSSQPLRNTYLWLDDITGSEYPNHWSRLYDMVTIANVAMESLETINGEGKQLAWNNVKGSALVYRAKAFLTITGYWTKAYDKNTAVADLGIPLRLNSDYNVISVRASLQETYDRILADLKTAIPLLPGVPQHVMRPSKSASYGLIARTYLLMNNYDSALAYTEKYLALKPSLLNYNNLSTAAAFPMPLYNAEVSMHSIISTPLILTSSRALVDSNLYRSYHSNDLRKALFFKANTGGSYAFRGSYNQSAAMFNGVATDEIYCIKAECQARLGKINESMETINLLMVNRWKTGSFVPFQAADVRSALLIILTERRKELIFRDLRWMDIKRLNREADFRITLLRRNNGSDYMLPPGDNRYAFQIPSSVIFLTGMPQNPR